MLTDKERAALTKEAQAGGFDVAAYLADAEQEDADGESTKPAGPNGKGEVGFFAFQYPFLTVNEIRESLGLPAVGDGGKFSGEWLASHGGVPKAPAGGDGE